MKLDIDITRRMVRQGRARVLVIGTERATGAVIRALQTDFWSPVIHVRAGGRLTLPENGGTLLVHDVSALDTADQDRLLQWLNLTPPGISVIAVAPEPLFPLVERGAFLADLFYRLNLIVIDVTDASCDRSWVQRLFRSRRTPPGHVGLATLAASGARA